MSWRTNVQVYKFHLFFNYNLQKPRDLMRNTTFVIFALSLVWLCGCITQGRLTSLTFKKSFNYKTLDSSMEKLKSQYESSLQEQVSALREIDRKSTRLNSSHALISYAVFCLKKKKINITHQLNP